MPAIVALMKNVPDSWSEQKLNENGTLDRDSVDSVMDEVNGFALEQAVQIKEANPEAGYTVIALTAGPKAADAMLRKALAGGADKAVHLNDAALAGSDVIGTARALNAAIDAAIAAATPGEDLALIVAGTSSSDGATMSLPAIIAELRGIPAVTYAVSAQIAGDELQAKRVAPEGIFELAATLPAVLTVGEQAATPRYPGMKALLMAKKAKITALTLADLAVDSAQVGRDAAWASVVDAETFPPRQAGDVIRPTDAAEAARTIADFLAAQKHI